MKRTQTSEFDPYSWFIAKDGDQIVGMSLCRAAMPEDENMAWVDTLGVIRPYRKQGIGEALLLHTFDDFYCRGKTAVALGVDAQSLTGATRLYEKVGMKPYLRFEVLEKVLREGVDLTVKALSTSPYTQA